jgi:tetratricopeptide (TPR) repeat protein
MATLKHPGRSPDSPTPSAAPSAGSVSFARDRGASWLETAGLVLTLAPTLTRATVGVTTLPVWDMDPLIFPLPMSGLGPAGSMLVDALVLIGAALLLLASFLRGRGPGWLALTLATAGSVPVLIHALADGGSLHDQRIGFSWLAAVWAGLGVCCAAGRPEVRRTLAAVLLGLVSLLALRAVQQVLIEHPRTVADFAANKAATLAAHGWTPGSPSALAFERRLSQAEASGWFGLANVLATLASTLTVLGLGLCWKSRGPVAARVVVGALSLAGLACVALSGAKGGWLSLLIGLSALGVYAAATRAGRETSTLARVAPLIGLGAIVAPLLLVGLRGLAGERVGELSLLVRWFYAQGAARVFVENPGLGVGPAGFQAAYSLAKPPLSTEDVVSPHALVLDYPATLGLLGLAWIALLALAAVATGRAAIAPATAAEHAMPTRNQFRLALAIPAIATLAASALELPLASPDTAVVRALGLIAWCAGAWAVLRACPDVSRLRLPLAAAGAALLAHLQIDVAGTLPASAPIGAMLLGLAAARTSPVSTDRPGRPLSGAVAGAAALAFAALAFVSWSKAASWERLLIDAASQVRFVAETGLRLRLSSDPAAVAQDPTLAPKAILDDLRRAVGRPVEPTTDSIAAALRDVELGLLPEAIARLDRALAIAPSDRRVLRESTRLRMRSAELLIAKGSAASGRDAADRAIHAFGVTPASVADPRLGTADFRWAAALHERRASLLGSTDDLREAMALYDAAGQRDPYNLDHAVRALRLARQLNDPSTPERARRCLRLDELQRLDAGVKGLTDADRAIIEGVLGTGTRGDSAPPKTRDQP